MRKGSGGAALVVALVVGVLGWVGAPAPAAAAHRPTIFLTIGERAVQPTDIVWLTAAAMPVPPQVPTAGTLRLTATGPNGEREVTSVHRPDGLHMFTLSQSPCCPRFGRWTFVVDYLPSTPAYVASTSETLVVTWDVRNYFDGFVEAVYRELLFRPSDPSGKRGWIDLLRDATPRDAMTRAFVGSNESMGRMVSSTYQQLLDRAATAGEIQQAVPRLRAGLTFEQLAAEIIGTAEFWAASGGTSAAFVDRLYLRQLGRAPDGAGRAGFLRMLGVAPDTGTRTAAGSAFAYSPERLRRFVNGIYVRLLDRNGDSQGVAAWANLIATGTRDETVIALIASSNEYYWLNRLDNVIVFPPT